MSLTSRQYVYILISLGEWCKANVFAKDHAHGVRKLVTNKKLLSVIQAFFHSTNDKGGALAPPFLLPLIFSITSDYR